MILDGHITAKRADGRQVVISSGPEEDQNLLLTMFEPNGEIFKTGLMDLDTTVEALSEVLRMMCHE